MTTLRFKTCRLLSGNVWKRELTIIQRRILRRLRNKKRSIKRKIYSRENLNSYIQSQTTRKLSLFHGDSAQPNDTSNTNNMCLECVARSLLTKSMQARTNAILPSFLLPLSRRENRVRISRHLGRAKHI